MAFASIELSKYFKFNFLINIKNYQTYMTNNISFALVLALAVCTIMTGLIAMQSVVFAQGNATQVGNQTGNQTGNQSSGASSSTSPSTSGQQAGTPEY